MLFTFGLLASLIAVSAVQNTATGTSAVAAAAATALTLSPTSNVAGKAFNRIAIIWLENTDYTIAASDRMSVLGAYLMASTKQPVQHI